MIKATIYAISIGGAIVYVGVTTKTIEERLRQHIWCAPFLPQRISKRLRETKDAPSISELETISASSKKEIFDREKHWINALRAQGIRLLNGAVQKPRMKLVTVRIKRENRRTLDLISALTDRTMMAVMDDILEKERKRLEKKQSKKSNN